jgi:hypothetical protein
MVIQLSDLINKTGDGTADVFAVKVPGKGTGYVKEHKKVPENGIFSALLDEYEKKASVDALDGFNFCAFFTKILL